MTREVSVYKSAKGERIVEVIDREQTIIKWNEMIEAWWCGKCESSDCEHALIVRSVVGDILPLEERAR